MVLNQPHDRGLKRIARNRNFSGGFLQGGLMPKVETLVFGHVLSISVCSIFVEEKILRYWGAHSILQGLLAWPEFWIMFNWDPKFHEIGIFYSNTTLSHAVCFSITSLSWVPTTIINNVCTSDIIFHPTINRPYFFQFHFHKLKFNRHQWWNALLCPYTALQNCVPLPAPMQIFINVFFFFTSQLLFLAQHKRMLVASIQKPTFPFLHLAYEAQRDGMGSVDNLPSFVFHSNAIIARRQYETILHVNLAKSEGGVWCKWVYGK